MVIVKMIMLIYLSVIDWYFIGDNPAQSDLELSSEILKVFQQSELGAALAMLKYSDPQELLSFD